MFKMSVAQWGFTFLELGLSPKPLHFGEIGEVLTVDKKCIVKHYRSCFDFLYVMLSHLNLLKD